MEHKPYVEPPPATPHPAASSISGRVVLELSVVASLVGAAAFAVGGMASVLLFTLTGTLSVLLLRVLWPLAAPLVNPVLGLVLDIARATGNVILGVLTGGAVGSKGLPALFSDGYRYLTSGALFSSARTLGAIIFVLVAMAALAKFTLTRRPKDFTKWVSMRIVIFPKHALCSFVCSDLFHTLLMILCRLLGIFLQPLISVLGLNPRIFGKQLSLDNPSHKHVLRLVWACHNSFLTIGFAIIAF
jgi:hypothetical protein